MGAAENASPLSRVSVVPTLRTCLRSDPQHTPRGDIEVSVLLTRLLISAERVARVSVVPTLWRPMLMRSAVQASPEREQAETRDPTVWDRHSVSWTMRRKNPPSSSNASVNGLQQSRHPGAAPSVTGCPGGNLAALADTRLRGGTRAAAASGADSPMQRAGGCLLS